MVLTTSRRARSCSWVATATGICFPKVFSGPECTHLHPEHPAAGPPGHLAMSRLETPRPLVGRGEGCGRTPHNAEDSTTLTTEDPPPTCLPATPQPRPRTPGSLPTPGDRQRPHRGFTNFISRLFTFVSFSAGNVLVTCPCRETPWRATRVPARQRPSQTRWPLSTGCSPCAGTDRPSRTRFGPDTEAAARLVEVKRKRAPRRGYAPFGFGSGPGDGARSTVGGFGEACGLFQGASPAGSRTDGAETPRLRKLVTRSQGTAPQRHVKTYLL